MQLLLTSCSLRVTIASKITVPDDSSTAFSLYAGVDPGLVADSEHPFWSAAPPVIAGRDPFGAAVPSLETQIRSRWTREHLFVLFRCPYQSLHLKPAPVRDRKTWELWNWDVVELFIGEDSAPRYRYKEFELSPQGEWLDLAIDGVPPDPHESWLWISGFETTARIDAAQRVWHGCMRIPFTAIASAPAAPQRTFRVNFYRIEGRLGSRNYITWQPTDSDSFHVPEAFGTLALQP